MKHLYLALIMLFSSTAMAGIACDDDSVLFKGKGVDVEMELCQHEGYVTHTFRFNESGKTHSVDTDNQSVEKVYVNDADGLVMNGFVLNNEKLNGTITLMARTSDSKGLSLAEVQLWKKGQLVEITELDVDSVKDNSRSTAYPIAMFNN